MTIKDAKARRKIIGYRGSGRKAFDQQSLIAGSRGRPERWPLG